MFNSAKEVMRLPRFVLLVSWFVCERDYSEKLGMHFREVLEGVENIKLVFCLLNIWKLCEYLSLIHI